MNTSRCVKDEVVYTGQVFDVHRLKLRTPSGGLIDRDLVHYNGAVMVLPLLADGRMMLIRNYRYSVDETLWELPAGMLETGEDPAQAASRELLEETGLYGGRMEKLGQFVMAPGSTDEVMHAYVATDVLQGPPQPESYEEIQAEAMGEAAVRDMIASGAIHDAKTLACLALYWLKVSRL